jgi:hypothetical protein
MKPDDDPEDETHEFETVISLLNELAGADTEEFGKIAISHGFDASNAKRNAKSLWEKRDLYRTIARKHSSPPAVEF